LRYWLGLVFGNEWLTTSRRFVPDYVADSFSWIVGWITCQAVAAALLLVATLATFDRSLGRMQG